MLFVHASIVSHPYVMYSVISFAHPYIDPCVLLPTITLLDRVLSTILHASLTHLATLSLAMLMNVKAAQRARAKGTKMGGQFKDALTNVLVAAGDRNLNIPPALQAAATTFISKDDDVPGADASDPSAAPA
jgi:hypothetical protein